MAAEVFEVGEPDDNGGEIATEISSLGDSLTGHTSSLSLLTYVDQWLASHLEPWLVANLRYSEIRDGAARRLRIELANSGWDFISSVNYYNYPEVMHVMLQLMSKHYPVSDLPDAVGSLEQILSETGFYLSATASGLMYRVDAVVVKQSDEAIATAQRFGRPNAGKRLRSAWDNAYSLHPNPTVSHEESIKAVEAVMIPTVVPNDNSAIFSKALGQLKNDRSNWRLDIKTQKGDDSIEPLIAMLDRLGMAHLERHEGNVAPENDTVESARACVHLAATLVQWFSMGAVQKM